MINPIDGRGAGRGNGEGKRNEVNMDMADKAGTLEQGSHMVVLRQRTTVEGAYPDHVGHKSDNYQ